MRTCACALCPLLNMVYGAGCPRTSGPACAYYTLIFLLSLLLHLWLELRRLPPIMGFA